MSHLKHGKFSIFFLAILLAILLLSCHKWELYTIEWIEDGEGFRQFSTTERDYFDTAFHWWDDASLQIPTMTIPVEAEIKKMSGYENAGYGIIFCVQDSNNYYKLLITINQRYRISELVNNSSSTIRPWSDSSDLVAGYGEINKIRIEYEGANTFSIYFNDAPLISDQFVDPTFSGGYAGYYASVSGSENEQLPQVPVDVRFRLLQPIVDP